MVGGRERVVGVVGDLLGALGAAERVDAAVLGDLVEPGLEGERLLGLAHAAQRGDEDLLGHVLGAAVVLDHPEHVGVDAPLVALVEDLEGAVVAAADRGDQPLVASPPGSCAVVASAPVTAPLVPLPTVGGPFPRSRLLPSPPAPEPGRADNVGADRPNCPTSNPMAQITDIIRDARRAAVARRVPTTSGPTGCRSRARTRSRACVTGVSAHARAERARGRARRAARARPPRAVLELPPDRADAAAGRAPAAAVQARHQPRRLPPAARRASRASATTRSSRASSGAWTCEPFGALQGHGDRLPRALRRRRSRRRAARARARGDRRASRSCWAAGRSAIRSIGIVSGSAADTLARGGRGRPRRVPDRRAARAHHRRGARNSGSTFVAAGHYATETFGVRALGDLLAERFGDRARLRRPAESGLTECLAQVEQVGIVDIR